MYLPHMTWEEIANLDRSVVVVVPFGSMEQHSFHLPLATDSLIIETITKHLERKLPKDVLTLPVTWLGCSRHHMDFAGSLTAETETFMNTGEQIVRSMAEHQFRNFLLLNGHGGNINKVQIMVERLRAIRNPRLNVFGVTYWHLITEEIKAIRESPLGGMGHSGELETSVMLTAHPELVRGNRMEADGLPAASVFEGRDMFDPGSVTTGKTFKERTRHGGIGDPTTASARKGEEILLAVTSKLVQVVREIRSGNLCPDT